MKLAIDFGCPVFDEETAEAMTTADLDSFYASAGEADRLGLFFQLEASFYHYLEAEKEKLAARIAFLTAYYLFTPLTPPASRELALHYIGEAVRLDPRQEYREWRELMEKGN